ncbi:Lrp/AsnC family transcriptional regulator [Candidatus Bathyarchaeota archaeon]|nr:Lrp/AsnC family transcriptional regulator [Candidatus Bathyarchaeota archaeon]
MATSVELEDEEGVIKGPHYYLIKRRQLDDLEREIYILLAEKGPMPLSALWRELNCHLWELTSALKRLKYKGLLEEMDDIKDAYQRQG